MLDLGVSEAQSTNSKTRKCQKKSEEKLEMVLQLKKSLSLLDPVINPEKMFHNQDHLLSKASRQSDISHLPA